ncbi:MAG: 2-dehydro-3-deoxygalactonokinase [Balneolaceae bacterium]
MVDPIQTDNFLSCDWGTTSFRLKYVDAGNGMTMKGISNSEGIKTVHRKWKQYTGSLNRIDFYLSVLKKQIETLGTKLNRDLGGCPVIISGMASSSIGINELPYSRLPLALKTPKLHVELLSNNHLLLNDIYLVSGLQSSTDVMRGEETQLLGLESKYSLGTGTYLLAGTHSKHVYMDNSSITDFKTFMTGELFDLITTESILSQSISTHESTSIGKDFEEGVEMSTVENLLHALFKVRTRDLLHNMSHSANADYLSGLLIGTELADLIDRKSNNILIFGNSELQKRYSRACDILKIDASFASTDSDEDITVLGQRIILQQIIN